ncbi:uncharacterized protein LOC6558993 [Drosophila grimshawi]|uniref:uncharacterized protein LOC6558993 n=1 Tax=Drosophila grimshawi TaxID=7222 RepID=UPI0013EF389D|nr:uncharacterized protein LOC6558993 [Drosophila grimshawi]
MAVLIAAAASAVGENFFANSSCINSVKFLVIAFAVIAAAAATSISTEYLPPVDNNIELAESVDAPVEQGVLADDGYRYKTVRRLRLRHRRDVNELSNEYLPPVGEATQEVAIEAPAQESAVLADDGYRYKTVRRVIRRRRRDVNELSSEYLPPVGEATQEIAVETPLADDGYRYKTVRRVIRRRRDVSELSPEYLPPVAEVSQDIAIEAPVQESAALADDGYRYKTVRRVIRRRRDVNELSNEYLPPVGEATQEIAIEAPAQESAVLADDGYRYKTVRRVIRRRRRDVNELSNEYLPPVGEATQEIAIEAPAQESAVLADDGYRYKTVRRVIRRRRRDVNELSNEYLPPVGEATQEIAIEAPAQESAVLADDGYRYKTVRRVIRRRRRDVNELSSEYLPPVEQAVIDVPAEQTVVADDGYRYKTVRRLKYRRH